MPEAVAAVSAPRSGNLRVKATFTDFDRDQFRSQTFEYIARYFENSLAELGKRSPGIRSSFRAIDATAFEAAVYDATGEERSRCGVWLNSGRGFGGDIGCSSSGVGQRNAYNESLSIGDDGTSLGIRAGFAFGGGDDKKLLTQEGAAEHLWSALMAALQR